MTRRDRHQHGSEGAACGSSAVADSPALKPACGRHSDPGVSVVVVKMHHKRRFRRYRV
jgi:hypothetical protein